MAGARPAGVTIIAVITWINGLIGIISGAFSLIGGGGNVAWITIALGVIVLAVGVGLLSGDNAARIIAAIVFVITVGLAVHSLFNGGTLWSAIANGGLSLIALILLFTSNSKAFFGK